MCMTVLSSWRCTKLTIFIYTWQLATRTWNCEGQYTCKRQGKFWQSWDIRRQKLDKGPCRPQLLLHSRCRGVGDFWRRIYTPPSDMTTSATCQLRKSLLLSARKKKFQNVWRSSDVLVHQIQGRLICTICLKINVIARNDEMFLI